MNTWTFFTTHWMEITQATLDHLFLVAVALLIAIPLSVGLGILAVQRPRLRAAALTIANVFQTIPSLALFGFLIPIPFLGGVGKRTAIVDSDHRDPPWTSAEPKHQGAPGEQGRC